jgi:phage/plasmid-like protein (TIGR03299 family)
MSHDLEQYGNETAFVSAREDPWHRLGTVLTDTFTAEVAMQEAKLANWDVRKVPIYASDILDEQIAIPSKFATVRTSPFTGKAEVLGVVGSKYLPIQNEDHSELLNALVDESGAHFETAGSMNGGRQTFITMKLPNTISVGGIDTVETYIAGLNSHDGSKAFQFLVTPIRIVCANTQAMALRKARSRFSVRHTKNGTKSIIGQARDTLGMTFNYLAEFEVEAEKLIQESLSLSAFEEIVSRLYPIMDSESELVASRIKMERNILVGLFENSDTIKEIRGTRWAGYQAVTEYLDHFKTVQGKTAEQMSLTRALQNVSGNNDEIKQNAYLLVKAGI